MNILIATTYDDVDIDADVDVHHENAHEIDE